MNSRIFICDINIREKGHYLGYNQFLISYITDLTNRDNFHFIYNSSARKYLTLNKIKTDQVHFLDVGENESEGSQSKLSIWRQIVDLAHSQRADKVIFMDFDQYQIPIGTVRTKFKVSGIYFRPHHRIKPASNSLGDQIATQMKRWKKIISELILLKNKNVSDIFILNDHSGVLELNKFYRSKRFKYLADPIFDFPEVADESSFKALLDSTRLKYLIFGSITERKNVTNILRAYAKASIASNSSIILAGPMSGDYHQYLTNLVKSLNLDNARKEVVIHNGFTTDSDMEYIHAHCDVSLLIYKDFYGSSGLIGRAAKHQKFVITSSVGLMKEIVDDFELGISANPNSIDDISLKLAHAADHYRSHSNIGMLRFYEAHTPEKFASQLLDPK